VAAALIELGDAPEAWARLGFTPDAKGDVVLGEATIRLTGRGGGIRRVRAEGLTAGGPDGLPLEGFEGSRVEGAGSGRPPEAGPSPHPNGASAVDHVVALTGSLPRTVAALEAAGLDLRRTAAPMAFLRIGPFILEVVERGGDPPRLWGLVVVVPDLEGLGPLVGAPKDAVQPGRRIATVSREAGLGLALALMTPRRT
jgi:hypothetical protein